MPDLLRITHSAPSENKKLTRCASLAREELREAQWRQPSPLERKRWEYYSNARQKADSLDRKLGHAMGFGLMKPPELNSYPAAG